MRYTRPRRQSCSRASGMSLVELMVAMAILLVGVLGSLAFLAVGIGGNYRNRQSSNSTAMAQLVMEKIRSVGSNSVANVNITDCAGTVQNITVTGSAAGSGAQLLAATGGADYTQAPGSAGDPVGYYMLYTDCGTAGRAMTYDIRWRVVTPASSRVKVITVSARLVSAGGNVLLFSPPVTVRSMIGL
ncbi:MAG TPA: prepilin-type N-terminal cleavage/methylation domain-containing protein [Alphaproteobacteria bacterium]|nr:prepilin-type N-terminal cleavage/methylation domain-containing protein [Alphaproteobacteria bacterium]